MVILLILMKWAKPSIDESRRLRAKNAIKTKQSLPILFVLLGLCFVVINVQFVSEEYANYRKLTVIQQHGRRAVANVDSIYVHGCSRGGSCVLHARYHYTPIALSSRVSMVSVGDDRLGFDEMNDPNYIFANSTGHVPVAYDVLNPSNSAINFGDDVFRTDQTHRLISQIAAFEIPILLGFSALIVGIIYFNRRIGRRDYGADQLDRALLGSKND
jgi:hypothetical protein